jgi:hypothetical protein
MKADPGIRGAALAALVVGLSVSPAKASEPAVSQADSELSNRAVAVLGAQAGQTVDATALAVARFPPRTDTLTITIGAGRGLRVSTSVDARQGFVFQWTASGELLTAMYGEPERSDESSTIFDVAALQRQGFGTLVAPFDGRHGWTWRNQGATPVTVKVIVTGFQKDLLRAADR